jgi:hypothetical protein
MQSVSFFIQGGRDFSHAQAGRETVDPTTYVIKNIPRSRMHTYVNSSCRLWSLDQCQYVRIYTCILYLFIQQVVEAETGEEGATGTESEPRIHTMPDTVMVQ